ncbi:MAG: UDP-N-acetylmuramoyl-tripeptide--D-alanyl-D-alanine ligase [Clostridiales bacterium]|nr:UDP-N-acetylmuramoyl-tripeptide--D-alanyl-D-alanine ligase [Clostridiales bacterium]
MKPVKIKDIVNAVGGTLLCGNEKEWINHVSVNSNDIKEHTLFVPLVGERVDAHAFIEGAIEKGVRAVFTQKQETKESFMGEVCVIFVPDTKAALQAFASMYRDLFSIPVIGITGSVGKTTTKEMVAAALSAKYNVLKTYGNQNSQVGLPLMMFEIEEDTQIAVIEMGISEEGEMRRLCAVAKPETVIMTNIGVSHIGILGSKENIMAEKLNITLAMKDRGNLYLNNEDELLRQIPTKQIKASVEANEILEKITCIPYGLHSDAQIYATNIRVIGRQTHFIYVKGQREESIALSVLGAHNVLNALAALAVAEQYGVNPTLAKERLQAYEPIEKRGQIVEKKGIVLIDDSYNASPDSIKSGILVLLQLEGVKRRIAVLADVLELGEASYQCHYEVGEFLAKQEIDGSKIDGLITVGEEAKAIAKAASIIRADLFVESFDSNAEASCYLKEHMKAGDAFLVKGSRGMRMDEVVSAVMAELEQ